MSSFAPNKHNKPNGEKDLFNDEKGLDLFSVIHDISVGVSGFTVQYKAAEELAL